jgi:polyferredoxin
VAYLWLADIVVAVHLSYACFVLFGFLAILTGTALHWHWTRNLKFRVLHLVCTGVVGVEAVWGATCPLTVLENRLLRAGGEAGYQRSFAGHLMNDILFYDAPERVFSAIYIILTLVTLWTFVPVWRESRPARSGSQQP